MKNFFIIAIAVFMFIPHSCYKTVYYWEFEYDYSQVAEISIVEANGPRNYEVFKNLDLTLSKELMEKIEAIEFKKYGSNPYTVSGLCFLIEYQNGDYDIISHKEPMHCKLIDGEIEACFSWYRCDEESFNELINEYVDKERCCG